MAKMSNLKKCLTVWGWEVLSTQKIQKVTHQKSIQLNEGAELRIYLP